MDTERPAGTPPQSLSQAFGRGCRLVCPLCGHGRLFEGWIRMAPKCSQCNFVFERDPGYFLGSTYINYGMTTVISTFTYIILRFVVEVGDWVLIPVLATFCVIFPVVFFRYARSLWLSLDCCFDPTGALESRIRREDSEVKLS